MAKTPPIPKDNRNSRQPGKRARPFGNDKTQRRDDRAENPDQQGQAANTRQNLIHQGNRRSSATR
jgi:hypothetical protein